MPDRVAILLAGGFVKKKLMERMHTFPTATEICVRVGGFRRFVRALSGVAYPRVHTGEGKVYHRGWTRAQAVPILLPLRETGGIPPRRPYQDAIGH
jgi:hypothetical protein